MSEAIELLKSINAGIQRLIALQKSATPTLATDRDLDGKYGDPVVKFDPRDWTGRTCKGLHLSQCPAPFLDLLAETFDYFARKADADGTVTDKGKSVADYKRQDAARARGWAKRIRDGKVKSGEAESSSDFDAEPDDDFGRQADDF